MGIFRYEAVDSGGRTVRGTLNASDRLAAARALRGQGLVPTLVSTSTSSGLAPQIGRVFRGHRTVLRFTEDLATLLDAGVALERALSIAAETADNEDESALASQILGAVRGGGSLADALALRPEYFSRLYVNSVRTGEVAGELPLVMAQLASFERGRERLRTEILTAAAYPVLLLIVGATSILVILMYVVPKFATSFFSTGFEPPVSMRLLIAASTVAQEWWPILLLLPAIAVLGIWAWALSEPGRLRLDSLLLRAPLLGRSLRRAETARFARAMSTLLAAAVPMVDALGVARSVLANRAMNRALGTVVRRVRRGEGLSGPVERSGAFPALAARLLAVGEETGELARMFERLAETYDRQTRESLKRFTALFEPLVILALGILVGIMILSILTAITSVQRMGL